MRVVGLDPSLSRFGYADPAGHVQVFGVPAAKARGGVRLAMFEDWFDEILPPGSVDLAVVEDYAFSSKQRLKGVAAMGELGGVLRLHLHLAGIPVLEVKPQLIKMFATGHGNAPKAMMQKAACQRLGAAVSVDDNEADALWLREFGLGKVGLPHRGHDDALYVRELPLPDGVERVAS